MGAPFDVAVKLSVRSLGATGVDLSFVLPDGVEITGGGVCLAGSGSVECVDAVPTMASYGEVLVTMVWNPSPGVNSASIEVSVSDNGIEALGMQATNGNPDNNTTTVAIKT